MRNLRVESKHPRSERRKKSEPAQFWRDRILILQTRGNDLRSGANIVSVLILVGNFSYKKNKKNRNFFPEAASEKRVLRKRACG